MLDRFPSGHVKLVDFGLEEDGLVPRWHGLGDSDAEVEAQSQKAAAAEGVEEGAPTSSVAKPAVAKRPPQTLQPVGSIITLAPELLDTQGGCSVDYWCLGIVMHEMLTGRSPWKSEKDVDILNELRKDRGPIQLNAPPKQQQASNDDDGAAATTIAKQHRLSPNAKALVQGMSSGFL